MCGIAGVLALSRSEAPPLLTSAIARMMDALRHRGPDDQGISNCDFTIGDLRASVLLATQRLAIIDRSPAGHQPMRDEDSGLMISYNGEVYNFRELRKEIGDEFGPWHSATDTEVVLRAYRKWGLGAFEKLRGMFALAIWDPREQKLVLARDPFGIKPLYYISNCGMRNANFGMRISDFKADLESGNSEIQNSRSAHGTDDSSTQSSQHEIRSPKFEIRNSPFLFASEVRALLASGLVPRHLSLEGIRSFLSYGSVQAPSTIIEDVRSLMPGHYLVLRPRDPELQIEEVSYLNKHQTLDNGTTHVREEMVKILRAKLEESVRLHLVSDVPLGVFLSGGMDSSALVALMSRVTPERPKTFSVVFDEKKFDEAGHARMVARQFDSEHREIHLNENQLLDLLPDALEAMDQPTIDGINTYVVSRAVKEAGVTVALSGLGGDELFAGYPSFRRAQRLENTSSLSRGLLRFAATIAGFAPGQSRQREKLRQLAQTNGKPGEVYRITRQLFSQEQVMDLMNQELSEVPSPASTSNFDTPEFFRTFVSPFTAGAGDVINQISQLELSVYMANTLLRDTDSMSMSHSLEVRVPFVDIEVARLVLNMPGNWKLNGSQPKPLLADAMRDLLPSQVLERPKMGFTLPFEKWMQSRLRRDIASILEGRSTSVRAGLDPKTTTKVWRSFLQTPRAVGWSRPWALYVLSKWCELNCILQITK